MPDRHAVQLLVAVREDGPWRACSLQNTPAQLHGHPEAVEALDHALGLGLREAEAVDHQQRARRVPAGERRAQCRLARRPRQPIPVVPRPLLVVIKMAPSFALEPYRAAAVAPFSTVIDSTSSGLIL